MSCSTNFSSLTSQTLDKLMDSSLFFAPRCASRYSNSPKSSSFIGASESSQSVLENYLEQAIPRPRISYHLHYILSTAARVVATIAIDILVSPVGLLFHTSQALYHRNVVELRNRHLKCASVELLRVVSTAYLASRYFYPTVYRTMRTGTTELARVAFASLPLMLSFTMLNLEAIYTIIAPGYNSRYLDDHNGDLFAKMALKSELGIDFPEAKKEFLDGLVNIASDRLQKAVNELHQKLQLETKSSLIKLSSEDLLKMAKKSNNVEVQSICESVLHNTKLVHRLYSYLEIFPRSPLVYPNDFFSNSNENNGGNNSWAKILQNTRDCIISLKAESNNSNGLYKEFKKRVLADRATEKTILGFSRFSAIKPSELNKAYKKLVLVVHPDKVDSETLKQEANLLFNILKEAHEYLENPDNNQLIPE